MALAAGLLRHQVRIDEYVQVLDSNGDPVRGPQGEFIRQWVPFHEPVMAAIEPLSAREFIQSASMQSQITARITIRYIEGLRAEMRIVHIFNGADGKIYNPAGFLADKVSGLEYLTIPVSEGVSEEGQ